jgi:hypothetical protein
MTYVALLFGLLGAYRDRLWAQLLMLCLGAGLLGGRTSMLWDSLEWLGRSTPAYKVNPAAAVGVASAGLLLFALVTKVWRPSTEQAALRNAAAGIVRVASLAVLWLAAAMTMALPFPPRRFLDRTNDPFFAAVAAEQRGLLLTSGTFHLVQLYTRRPVLLDAGGLDSLPYAPESGPAMDRILRDVYQIDLFHPPVEAKGAGAIPHAVNRAVWQRYSRDKWREIGRAYNVTQVISRSDYELDLPIAAQTPSLRLYRIPE